MELGKIISYILVIGLILWILCFLYKKGYGVTVYFFHRSSCPHSVKMYDEWDKFYNKAKYSGDITAYKISTESTNPNDKALIKDFKIRGVPHIVKVKNNMRTKYTGERSADKMYTWARNS